MKTAVIFGITGQDGSYLAELLLKKNYEVIGVTRRVSVDTLIRVKHVLSEIKIIEGDITDGFSVSNIVNEYKPCEIYNHSVGNYRNSYNMFACSGILFNHESERRGEKFVTRKITKWIGNFVEWENTHTRYHCKTSRFVIGDDYITVPNKRMYLEQMAYPSFPKLRLGNLDAYRDWGHAEDYVRAMWLMVQQEKPDDYVIATGETHSVRDFLVAAFNHIDIENFMDYIVIDPEFYRPSEVDFLCGRFSKAQMQLEWEPDISFTSLVQRMVEHDTHETRLSRPSL